MVNMKKKFSGNKVMKGWNFFYATIFVFVAVTLLTVAIDMVGDAQRAQILVAPEFGQLADQAYDDWRSSILQFFRVFGF